MKSKIRTLIDLVEAGEIDLAQDFVEDSRTELHTILEFSVEDKSYKELAEGLLDHVTELYEKHPEMPGHVKGVVMIAEIEGDNSYRMALTCAGTMSRPYNLIGALQYVTAQQMDETLGGR